MADALKPCPAGCHTDFITMQQVGTRHMMKCDCGWTAPIRANKERAITAWNKRAAPPTDAAQGDDARDGARYRRLRERASELIGADRGLGASYPEGDELDALVDAMADHPQAVPGE